MHEAKLNSYSIQDTKLYFCNLNNIAISYNTFIQASNKIPFQIHAIIHAL